MTLTPGLRFLITSVLPYALGPPFVLRVLLLLAGFYNYDLKFAKNPWILVPLYGFSPLIYYYILGVFIFLRTWIAARRMGARLLPRVRGYLPGNVDFILEGITANKTDYFGSVWISLFDLGGASSCSLETLGDDRAFTRNPKNIQRILATDFENHSKGALFSEVTKPLLGAGVFNSDGEMWQFHRKLARPFFSKERVTDLVIYERKAVIAIQKMQEQFDQELAVDFQDLVARFTLDSAAEFLLGVSTNSLDAPLPMPYNSPETLRKEVIESTPSTRFAKAFAGAQLLLLDRFDLAHLWPLGEMFGDKMEEPMKDVNGFVEAIVRNVIERKGKEDAKQDEDTLLEHLVTVTDDMKVIIDQTLNILLAGRDTTACLLTFTTYCLSLHPDVLQRLREEILKTVGPDRAPTYDDIREMKYLRAVLNETLRLYPPVPFNVRETINETFWYDDDGGKLYLPPKTRVGYTSFHLQRDEKYWGPDAHVFDPDRWIDERLTRYTSNPFIYIPFNAGPRICLGQQFAYNEASFFLIRLLQHFESFELASECQPPHTRPPANWQDPTTETPLTRRRTLEKCFLRSHLTLYADGGMWLRAKQAKA